ncbi:L%2CD-carboxypeptidase A [uncultured Roseburia sp.]|uniref:LD-carboxypeptidase n=1 Tax=Brotonthovivens ammoniilytica TaxID=2981725 RepID=A0ABT2THM6_9FIRM|nr:S66 peptidase family protein [Brotonthovivens ammoniilytica]MCU6761690.1 LD-carboxypeptidase [Brotonthovivens ammoniilytica]SCI43630.1 L%2CD-carboxypeptidase A [uncultured Roseburia sp.]
MRYPEFLKENGTIGFVAPSFGCNIEPYRTAFDHALERFWHMGYQTALGPNCYEGSGIGISSTPESCGRELMDYYCSEENDVLISCGGGELMCEDLDFLEFDKIRQAPPKWYMGYSDNTNFTFLLTTLCDTASIYGPCAAAFGMEPWHPAIYDAWDVLRGKKQVVCGYDFWEKESLKDEEHPLKPYHVTEPRVLRTFPQPEVKMRGRLLGGCLDILVNLLGTKFDGVKDFTETYKEDGIIWFMEACDLNVMSIRRALWQIDHAGWFRYVKGFLIGRPLCHGQELMGLDQYEAVMGILKKYEVPVVMDVDLGHIAPMMPLICGSYADIKVKGNDISVEMSLK